MALDWVKIKKMSKMLPSELLTEPTRISWNMGSLHWMKIVAFGWVLGRLGPGQSGPRQLGPGNLGPGQLSGAQLSALKRWSIGPWTVGPQKYFEIIVIFLLVYVVDDFKSHSSELV